MGGDGAAAARVVPAAGEALMEGGGVELLAGRGGRRTRHACLWGGLDGGGWRRGMGGDEAAAARVTPVAGEALMVGGGVELFAGAGRPPHASGLSLGGP